jgi:plasmid stability protein
MPTLILKNISRDLHARLQARARRNHRSLTKEAIALIERQLAEARNESQPLSSMPLNAERRRLIKDSGYFDRAFYLARNADVAGSAYDPLDHYVWWGGDENRPRAIDLTRRTTPRNVRCGGLSPETAWCNT